MSTGTNVQVAYIHLNKINPLKTFADQAWWLMPLIQTLDSVTKTDELVHVMSIRPARALKTDSTFKSVLNIDLRDT